MIAGGPFSANNNLDAEENPIAGIDLVIKPRVKGSAASVRGGLVEAQRCE